MHQLNLSRCFIQVLDNLISIILLIHRSERALKGSQDCNLSVCYLLFLFELRLLKDQWVSSSLSKSQQVLTRLSKSHWVVSSLIESHRVSTSLGKYSESQLDSFQWFSASVKCTRALESPIVYKSIVSMERMFSS